MTTADMLFLAILFSAVFTSYKMDKLTLAGSLTGGVMATSVYLGAGLAGIAMLGAFFVLATWATSWRKKEKSDIMPDYQPQKRDAGQVIANGGVAAILGLNAYFFPAYRSVFEIMLASALASATADTLSSEMGTVYGRRFYNILNFKPDDRGKDGVISLEGTLIGTAGAAGIALIYFIGLERSMNGLIITIAGTAGNLADSVLGASLERKGYLTNNCVNFLNTAFAAIIALLLFI